MNAPSLQQQRSPDKPLMRIVKRVEPPCSPLTVNRAQMGTVAELIANGFCPGCEPGHRLDEDGYCENQACLFSRVNDPRRLR